MKQMMRLCLTFMALCVSCAIDATSSKQPSTADLYEQIQKISAREQQLTQEVQDLQAQLRQRENNTATTEQPSHTLPEPTPNTSHTTSTLSTTKDHLAHNKSNAAAGVQNEWERKSPYGYFGPIRFSHGVTVTTSPVLGLKSAFDAADLLYQYPSMNEDLILLQQRENFQQALMTIGDTLNNRAILVISGGLEGQIISVRDFNGLSEGDINLSTAEIDLSAMVSTWTNLFVALDYDDSAPATGSRGINSEIYLSRGWFTIGNLSASPVYFTIGQMYLPFGRYTTVMLTAPLTLSLGRVDSRTALVGYYQNGFYGEVYGYRGRKTSGIDNMFKQGGVNLGYHTVGLTHNTIFDIGVGALTNIADSQGMQQNGLTPNETNVTLITGQVVTAPTQFAGFGETNNGNALAHDVAGANIHAEFSHKGLTIIAEYIGAIQSFSPNDLTINGQGARPQAVHFEVDYTIHVHNKPLTFAATYGRTWDALALNLPNYSATLNIGTVVWKNTSLGIEYRHDISYPSGTTATGTTDGISTTNQPQPLPVPTSNGRQRNMFTIQFGAYF